MALCNYHYRASRCARVSKASFIPSTVSPVRYRHQDCAAPGTPDCESAPDEEVVALYGDYDALKHLVRISVECGDDVPFELG
jgi:hypothetical protein